MYRRFVCIRGANYFGTCVLAYILNTMYALANEHKQNAALANSPHFEYIAFTAVIMTTCLAATLAVKPTNILRQLRHTFARALNYSHLIARLPAGDLFDSMSHMCELTTHKHTHSLTWSTFLRAIYAGRRSPPDTSEREW